MDNMLINFDSPTAILIALAMLLFSFLALSFSNIRKDSKLKKQSAESERKFQSVIESAKDAIIVTDHKGSIIHWNHGAQTIFGFQKEEVLGRSIDLIVPERFKEGHRKGMERYNSTREPRVIGKTVELTGCGKDGSEFPLEMSLGTWETEQGLFFSSIIRDITERKLAEDKINNLVYLDPLTGLPNRRLFYDRLTLAINQAEKEKQPVSLLFIDLDHFKLINDTFGHSTGDQLLKDVTVRLKSLTTENDTIARLGGDEFLLLLPYTGSRQAADFAQNLLNAFNKPFSFEGEEVFVTPSIGISLYPEDGQNQEALIKNADLALYRVKEEGRNGFQFFTREMKEAISRKSILATSLRKGLDYGEFTINYQPQIDLKTDKIIGVEALSRWNHSKMGNISPAEFIPIAEETGAILQIGEFVLREACKQNKAWQDAGLPPFRVAVNISARQFTQIKFAETVRNALEDSNLDPHYLELELTESIIQGSKSAISMMQELKAMGVHLSIDDFGTGYSSLSYLKLFPIDTLKIDQSFTRNLHIDAKTAALVDTIIGMAHNLELNVIAEGVETKEQLEFLKRKKCDQAQGYYFNRPLPAEEIEKIYMPQESFR